MQIFQLKSPEREVSGSRFFSYPTRLANPWTPEILQVEVPGEQLTSRSIELQVVRGSTREHTIRITRDPAPHEPSRLLRTARATKRRLAAMRTVNLEPGCIGFDTREDAYWSTGNAAHTLVNAMPILFHLRSLRLNIVVIAPETGPTIGSRIYSQLGFQVIHTDATVCGDILCGTAANEDLQVWRTAQFGTYSNAVEISAPAKPELKRLLIARKNVRRLLNEPEVEAQLKKLKFTKIYLEEMPLDDQWAVCSHAEAVVAIHGAGIANLVFNRMGVKLVELQHPGYRTGFFRRCVNSIDGQWVGVGARMPPGLFHKLEEGNNPRQFANDDLLIDIDSLKQALDYLGV